MPIILAIPVKVKVKGDLIQGGTFRQLLYMAGGLAPDVPKGTTGKIIEYVSPLHVTVEFENGITAPVRITDLERVD